MRRILLTGCRGQVGWELHRSLATLGEVIACDRKACDLSSSEAIRNCLRTNRPALIVNAAAFTAVERAESEQELAMQINGIAPGIMAEEARKLQIPLVHYSTDYVFEGNLDRPLTENDLPNPLNAYGRSKLAGEMAIQAVGGQFLIIRTGWVYGARGRNFFLAMLQRAKEQEKMPVVNDQWGAPTWCRFLAEATGQILAQPLDDKWGLYHLSGVGRTTWYEFAQTILRRYPDRLAKLVSISSSAYPSAVKRPRYACLSSEKARMAFGVALPDWKIGLDCVLNDF